MLDGTAILDIKPYLSNVPEASLRRGWLAEAEARANGTAAVLLRAAALRTTLTVISLIADVPSRQLDGRDPGTARR